MNTTHLTPLYALNPPALAALVGMLGSHFVSNDTLDRDTLQRYVAEAEAVAS